MVFIGDRYFCRNTSYKNNWYAQTSFRDLKSGAAWNGLNNVFLKLITGIPNCMVLYTLAYSAN